MRGEVIGETGGNAEGTEVMRMKVSGMNGVGRGVSGNGSGVSGNGSAVNGNSTRIPDNRSTSSSASTGTSTSTIQQCVQLCEDAHRKLCPDVPLCGWDVALVDDDDDTNVTGDTSNAAGDTTPEEGPPEKAKYTNYNLERGEDGNNKANSLPPLKPILLEVNLSCNFFLGSFDRKSYFEFMNSYFLELDGVRRSA
jgi:hypothetical protein